MNYYTNRLRLAAMAGERLREAALIASSPESYAAWLKAAAPGGGGPAAQCYNLSNPVHGTKPQIRPLSSKTQKQLKYAIRYDKSI